MKETQAPENFRVRSVVLCVSTLCALLTAGEDKPAPGPATNDPGAIVDWFVERDAEFFDLKKSGAAKQKKFKTEILRDIGTLKDAAEVQIFLKRQTVILNWITQYMLYQRYIKRGKYSPEEDALVKKMEANLAKIPSKTQLLQAGFEVSDEMESWVAMRVKVVSHYLQRKHGVEPKAPTKEEEAAIQREFVKDDGKK